MMSDKNASPALQAVHDERAAEAQNYERSRRSVSVWAPLTGIMGLGNAFLIWLAFFHFPQDAFVPTTNAAAVCRVPAINEPTVDLPALTEFAVDVAVGVNTYDFKSYQRQIETVAERTMTEEYRNAYISAFGNSKVLETVKQNFFVASATTSGTGRVPVPSRHSNPNAAGPAWWVIDVPLLVSYTAGNKAPSTEKLLLKITIQRVPPTRMNSRGIAVSKIESSYLLN
ncbi:MULTISPECIES: DotI/IcmL family type IV secretion protein [Cupriavidus]